MSDPSPATLDLLEELLRRQIVAPPAAPAAAPPPPGPAAPVVRPARPARRFDTSVLSLVIVGYMVAGFFWIIGARYTIDGLLWLVNWIFAFLTIPLRLPFPPEWTLYLILMPVPYFFSRIEMGRLSRKGRGRMAEDRWAIFSIWSIIVIMDLTTTFVGLSTPNQAMGQLGVWFSTELWARAAATFFLTFWPEWVLKQMNQLWRQTTRER